jgi:hypothetical protein
MRKVLCLVEHSSAVRADDDDGEKARRYFQQRKRDGQAAAEYMEREVITDVHRHTTETQNSAGTSQGRILSAAAC